jgi:hypothetical protein
MTHRDPACTRGRLCCAGLRARGGRAGGGGGARGGGGAPGGGAGTGALGAAGGVVAHGRGAVDRAEGACVVIGSRWVPQPLAPAGELRPPRLNHQPHLARARCWASVSLTGWGGGVAWEQRPAGGADGHPGGTRERPDTGEPARGGGGGGVTRHDSLVLMGVSRLGCLPRAGGAHGMDHNENWLNVPYVSTFVRCLGRRWEARARREVVARATRRTRNRRRRRCSSLCR